MAGSWNHAIDDDGSLLESEDLAGMLENGGDVWEFAGMVWLLASLVSENVKVEPEDVIEMARENYKQGLKFAEQRLKEKNE